MLLTPKQRSVRLILETVLSAALIHSVVLFCSFILIQKYFSYLDRNEFKLTAHKIFEFHKPQMEQDVYINTIIKEKKNADLPAVKSFLKALDSSSFIASIVFQDCKKTQEFALSIPVKPYTVCFDLVHLNNAEEKNKRFILPFVLLLFLTSIPVYYFFYKSVKGEASLQLKSELIDEMRHNLNSPLITLHNLIDNNSTTIPRKISEELKSKVQVISEYLKETKNNLVQTPEEVFEVGKIIKGVVEDKRIELQSSLKQIEIHLEMMQENILIRFQSREFERILSNLLNNSINAIEKKGSIQLKVVRTNSSCVLRLIDSGRGVPPDKMKLLFQKGFTFNSPGGTGSGLYQAKYKLEKEGGKISLECPTSGGTIVELEIPLSKSFAVHSARTRRKLHLLEDDKYLKMNYINKIKENSLEKHFEVFFHENANDLLKHLDYEDKSQIFILDSQIYDDKSAGIDLAKLLHSYGLQNIYIHSGYSAETFSNLSFLKGIIRKDTREDIIFFLHGLVSES
jgi:hypothetical protein